MLATLLAAVLATQQPAAATEVAPVDVAAPAKLTEEQAISAFVDDVVSLTGNERLGRWDKKFCPGVLGMPAQYAQYVNDRMASLALELGLKVGEPGCRPSVIVALTDDADGMARHILKTYPDVLSRYDLPMTAGRQALDRFVASDAPVRWWHVTRRVDRYGQRYNPGGTMRVYEVSRIQSNTRDDFDRAIVIVDAKRVGTVRFEALADYLAMVSLAQIDPEASPSTGPSILNLFADREAGREPQAKLTDWDRAYVAGLYDARRNTIRVTAQKRDIRRTMKQNVEMPAPE